MTDEQAGTHRPDADHAVVRRLVGVYAADGSVRGEIAYVVGRALGRAHCALCDVTHGRLTEKAQWRECRAGMPVPFDVFHRNDQPDAVRAAVGGRTPVVVAQTDGGIVELLDGPALDACAGSPDALAAALEVAVARAGLRWR